MTHGGAKVKLDARLEKIELRLRDVALSFPETTEDFPWGHRTIKVKGKAIVFMGSDEDGRWGISVKLPQSSGGALMLPFAKPAGYGLGKAGWIDAGFYAGDDVPTGILEEWLRESYRAVAPKKLAAVLDASPPPSTTAARAKASARKTAPAKKKAAPSQKAPAKTRAAPAKKQAAPRAKASGRAPGRSKARSARG